MTRFIDTWWFKDLLDRELSALATDEDLCQYCCLLRPSFAVHSPRAPEEEMFCQHSAVQSWSRPSRSPCIELALAPWYRGHVDAGNMQLGSAPQPRARGAWRANPGTYQKVRNSQSYTFLKSPAMIAKDTAAVQRKIEGWKILRSISTRVPGSRTL